jgi:hypothetical protein
MIFRAIIPDGENLAVAFLEAANIVDAATAAPDAVALVNTDAEETNFERARLAYEEISNAQSG